MRVAIVHYWFVNRRGGEKVVEAILDMYPQADLYTHVCDPAVLDPVVSKHEIFTTFIQKLPFSRKLYQLYLPLMPFALEALDLSDYDLVVSSESGPAKGVIVSPQAMHICYCHSPMRYLWDMHGEYRKEAGLLTRLAYPGLSHWLRMWDQLTAQRVDHFVANSQFVSKRIRKYYGRDSVVIHPPVDVGAPGATQEREDFYLWVGELVAYKRPDLAVQACSELGRSLLVIGDGKQKSKLEKLAGPTIAFAGRLSDEEVRSSMHRCKALIFPGREDFGIVPVEAMASGAPVIAFDSGGASETLIDGVTGVMFSGQTVKEVKNAIVRFESRTPDFEPTRIRQHASMFSRKRFVDEFRAFVDGVVAESLPLPTNRK